MNSAYGKGAEGYFGCKPVGLSLCQNLVGQINSKPLKDGSPRAQVLAEHIYLEPTQQLENNCGAVASLNIAGVAAWYRLGQGTLEEFLGELRYNDVLSSPNRKEVFESLIKAHFNGIKTIVTTAAQPGPVASSTVKRAVMN